MGEDTMISPDELDRMKAARMADLLDMRAEQMAHIIADALVPVLKQLFVQHPSTNAVDPSVTDPGTPTPRDKSSEETS